MIAERSCLAREKPQTDFLLRCYPRSKYEARRTLRELELLENFMLRDIGLDRGGLEHAARFGRPRHPAA